jgi:hypothetical protein
MQSVKMFMRQVGTPNGAMGVVSVQEVEEELEYKYLSQGFEVFETHYLGEVRDENGNALGYKMMFVLTGGGEPREPAVAQKPKSLKDVK